tara:strand:+ start:324 stop:1370 length:1047 start_codon:yes stop_codon:yes gene_type:complete
MISLRLALAFALFSVIIQAQYTDQINSNRPGASIGAFAVGKNVIQSEIGLSFHQYSHSGYNNSSFKGGLGFIALRWGFLFETLELTLESKYLKGSLNSKILSVPISSPRNGFLQNFIGFKYLFYDPFKKEREENVYSWKANNGFKFRELIPAISITLGTNINFEKNNPFPFNNVFGNIYRPIFFQNLGISVDEEPFFHLRGTLATQSHFLSSWVFVTNFSYDRYLSIDPQMSYILTLTHTLNPLWSVYIESQGNRSELYRDSLFRLGFAYLYSDNIQVEATIGGSTKSSPSRILANVGVSYRLDFHKDFISAEEIQSKALKKEERSLNKTLKKNTKKERKRNRKAKSN